MAGPDFIGIGAQRAGTSWLHAVLERHPALWLPPVKELHYFDDTLSQNRNRYYGLLRMRMIAGLWVRRPLSLWDLSYFLGRRSDAWYSNLFETGRRKGKRTGEITPSYATLSIESFLRMRTINPEVKIIFIMRDPVLRSWSSIIKSREKHGLNELPSAEAALDHSRREGVMQKSSYVETIKKVDRVFRPHQVFYGFFEDMVGDPGGFVERFSTFLEVDGRDARRLLPPPPIGAAASSEPAGGVERSLATLFLPEVEELCVRFEGAPHASRPVFDPLEWAEVD